MASKRCSSIKLLSLTFVSKSMCQLTPKLIYIHPNKVFLPNFMLKINKTGILWYRGILWLHIPVSDIFLKSHCFMTIFEKQGQL